MLQCTFYCSVLTTLIKSNEEIFGINVICFCLVVLGHVLESRHIIKKFVAIGQLNWASGMFCIHEGVLKKMPLSTQSLDYIK